MKSSEKKREIPHWFRIGSHLFTIGVYASAATVEESAFDDLIKFYYDESGSTVELGAEAKYSMELLAEAKLLVKNSKPESSWESIQEYAEKNSLNKDETLSYEIARLLISQGDDREKLSYGLCVAQAIHLHKQLNELFSSPLYD